MPKRRKRARRAKTPRKTTAGTRPKSLRAARAQIPVAARDKRAGKWFEKLVALQARLYGPGGCPWDREQTHESLRKLLIEETYEVLEAMESPDPRKFAGELGDLLLQVVFHSILAEKAGRFTISDVIESIHSKMVRRHPHVFGDVAAENAAAVLKNWEQIKAEERSAERTGAAGGKETEGAASESILGGVPGSLPGVLEAYQLTRRASHVGFDWDDLEAVLEKLSEEEREIRAAISSETLTAPREGKGAKDASGDSAKRKLKSSPKLEEEVGDLLFTAVNVARFLGVDPEIALKKANRKFKERFNWMEAAAQREGKRFAELPRGRMEELWNESKRTD